VFELFFGECKISGWESDTSLIDLITVRVFNDKPRMRPPRAFDYFNSSNRIEGKSIDSSESSEMIHDIGESDDGHEESQKVQEELPSIEQDVVGHPNDVGDHQTSENESAGRGPCCFIVVFQLASVALLESQLAFGEKTRSSLRPENFHIISLQASSKNLQRAAVMPNSNLLGQ
jgi:hypothetical protein